MSTPTHTPPASATPRLPGIDRPNAANYSDALTKNGHRFRAMDAGIRPVTATALLFGRAFTVACYPGATHFMERAVEEAQPGEIIVADGRGDPGAVLMGGLMGGRAFYRGVAGVVIDGAVRDIAELAGYKWPVFSRHVTPAGGVHEQAGSIGEAISCGGVTVRPGDYIIGDDDGVVCVPQELWAETSKLANEIWEKEKHIAEGLKQGLSLGEAAKGLYGQHKS